MLSWALYAGPSTAGLPLCEPPPAAPRSPAGHAVAGGCSSLDAELVCVRLQWRTCNGLWGKLSGVACSDWTAEVPSCAHAPRFDAVPPAAGDAYRMWRVHPDLPSVGCLRYEGNTSYAFTETTRDFYTACAEPEHLPSREFTGATFRDYTGVAGPWQHVDWLGAVSDPSAITDRVYTESAAPFQVFWLSLHVSNFAGLQSGDT